MFPFLLIQQARQSSPPCSRDFQLARQSDDTSRFARVTQSNGYIWVYSEPGRGSTFKVYLPSSDLPAPAEEIPSVADDQGEQPSETILLVEDAGSVRQLTKRILDRAGYHVLEAVNGDDAERVLADHGESVDLMLTDVIMPGGGGPELYGRLERRQPGLRVLYMSGYTPDSIARKAGLDRGLPYIQKPFTSAALMKQVRVALKR